MKNKNFLKKLTAGILGFVMTLGVGAAGYAGAASETKASAKTATLAPSKITAAGNISDDDIGTWAFSYVAKSTPTSESSGIHVGTNNNDATSITLSCNDYASKNIKTINAYAAAKASTGAYTHISIGGEEVATSPSVLGNTFSSGGTKLTYDNTTAKKTGEIVVQVSRASSQKGALYLNKIEVIYEKGTSPSANYTMTTDFENCTWDGEATFDGTDYYEATFTPDSGFDYVELDSVSYTGGSEISDSLYEYDQDEGYLLIESSALTANITVTAHGVSDQPSPSGDGYTLIYGEPDSWEGTYLLAYVSSYNDGNGKAKLWTGSDANNTSVEATFEDDCISAKPDTAVELLIESMTNGYSLKIIGGTNNGKYLTGGSSGSLGIGTTQTAHSLSYDNKYYVSKIGYSSVNLKYNSGSSRFRYYGNSSTTMLDIDLFKLNEPEKTIDKVTITNQPTDLEYNAGECFNPAGLVAHVTYVEEEFEAEDIVYGDDTAELFTFEPNLETPLTKTDSEVLFSYKDVTASVSIEITVNGIHKVTITGENSVYAGESITLNASCIDGDNVTTWLYGDDTSSQHITITGNGSTATIKGKKVGKATVKAKCANGTESDPFEITIASKPAGYALVTDAASLSAGDKLILGAAVTKDSITTYKAAGAMENSKYLTALDATVTDNIITCESANIITLECNATDGWDLSTSGGYIVASGGDIKNSSTADTKWTISIDTSGNASISDTVNETTYYIKYNSSNPRFKTYSSGQTSVQLYRLQSNDSIKYDANGGTGSTIRDENIYEEGDPFTAKPLTFTRQYYTATGWNTAKDGTGTSYTPGQSYTFESNMTLYAQWQGDIYTITYKNMGGSAFDGSHGDDYPTTHTYGSVTTLDTPTKTGYTFSGWFTDSACTGNSITAVGATDKTSDFTLYAKWDAVTNSIKYLLPDGSAASGTWASPGRVTSRTYGTETTLTTVSKTGYTFGGYYANAQLTGDPITKIGATEHPETGDINLYIKWTVKNHSITYYDRNENNNPVPYSGSNASSLPSNFDYDKGVTLVDGVKEHYTFKGWFSSYASTSKITAIAGDTPNNDKDFVLYAKWEADVYNLTYKYKNASGVWTDYTGAGVAKTHTYGTETTLTDPTALSGYSFKGFYTDEALQNKITVIGAEQITDDITIYMDTETSEFTLHYNNVVDDDMPVGMPTTHTYGTATTLPAAIDKVDGTYEFKGWYFNENLTTRVPGDLGNQQIPANKTGSGGVLQLYAKWEGSDHTITYKDQGDKSFSGTHQDGYAKKYTYGTAVTLDSPTKTGYDFNGYYNDSACEGTRVLSIPADHAPEAITVYAKWTAQTYTITYSGADIDYTLADGSPTSHTYDTVTELKAPSKTGFTFEGWFTSPSFSGDPISSIGKTAITTNITLYAKFVFGAQEGLDKLNKDIGMAYDKTLKDNGGAVETSWERYDGSQTIENGDKFVFVSRWTNSSNVTKYYAAKNEVDSKWYSSVEITDISSMSFADNLCWTVSDVVPKTETTDAMFNLSYVDSNNTTQYMSLGENDVKVVTSKPTNPLNYIAKKTVNQIDNYSVATTEQSGRVLMYRQDTGQKFRNYQASQIGNYTSEVMTFIKKGSSPRYENVDFRFNLKFAGLQSFAEKNNVDADYGIKLTMIENESVRERYFSLKNKTVTEVGVDGSKEFNYQGSADNGQLTLLLGDVLNEGSKDYHSPDIMFKIQLYVVDDKGNKYESETYVEYSVKSWVEYYHSISKYAAAVQPLYDIFFPKAN